MTALLEVPLITEAEAAAMFAMPAKSTIRWGLYRWSIKGMSALLIDEMNKRQVLAIKTKQKIDQSPDEPLKDTARRKLYATEKTEDELPTDTARIIIPGVNLFACLRDTGKDVQYGQGKNDRITLSTQNTRMNRLLVFAEPYYEILGLDGKPAEWHVDIRKGNATQGDGAVCIIRPMFNEWGLAGHARINVDLLAHRKAEEWFTLAGTDYGLCSFRPGKKGQFGMFELTCLEHIGGAEPKKMVPATEKTPAKRGRKKAAAKPADDTGDSGGDTDNGEPKPASDSAEANGDE